MADESRPDAEQAGLLERDRNIVADVARIRINPVLARICKAEGCRGLKGYAAEILGPGARDYRIRVCCGEFTETPYVVLQKRIDELTAVIRVLYEDYSKQNEIIVNNLSQVESIMADIARQNGMMLSKVAELLGRKDGEEGEGVET